MRRMNKKEILKRVENMINEINTGDPFDSLQSSLVIMANVKMDLMSLKNKLDEGE